MRVTKKARLTAGLLSCPRGGRGLSSAATSRLDLFEDLDRAGGAEADDVREADLGAFDLAAAGFTAQVPDDLTDVGDARRAERVPLREQAAAGVDGDLAADTRRAFVDH